MLSHRRSWFVASVVLALAGCSATGTGRLGGISRSGQKSLATVGDRPVLAATDDDASEKPADPAEPPRTRARAATANDHTRISGRVVDRNGEPVADAAVRLADGGSRSGRDLIARTDRSGGFTLAGLDSGATYTVIAEAEGQGGPLRGTVEAEGAETNIEIEVAEPDAAPAKTRRKPRGSRLVPISNRARSQASEVPAADQETQAPADETEPPGLAGSAKTRRTRGEPTGSAASSAWHRVGEAAPRAGSDDVDPLPPAAGGEAFEPGPGDDGPNPLPPAIERPARSRRPAPDPADATQDPDDEEQPGGMTTAPRAADPSKPRRSLAARPAPAPAAEAESATVASNLPELPSLSEGTSPLPPAAPAEQPAVAATPADPNAEFNPFGPGVAVLPATAPAAPAAAPAPAPPAPKTGTDYNPFADPFVVQPPESKPKAVAQAAPRASVATTKGSAFGPDVKPRTSPRAAPANATAPRDPKPAPTPAPERKLTWGDLPKVAVATRDHAAVAASDEPEINPLPQAAPAVAAAAAAEAEAPAPDTPRPASPPGRKAERHGKNPTISLCSFDARLGQLHDFQLPDLEGNPVGLKDLDADLILLDFWGTWCKPCVDAVPHLVALQKKFGPGRLAVVGVACEEDPPAEQKARVEAAARKLGINYTVLLSGTDGPCPLRAALKVQNLPTMIVMDRAGKIRWRAEGATPANLDRLDRVVAAATANSARAQTARR